jgi:hypothetical protein
VGETPEEKEALAKLDDETREVADDELQKEADRELNTAFSPRFGITMPGPLAWMGRFRPFRWKKGDPVPEPVDDEDPGDERGLRDALRGDDAKP